MSDASGRRCASCGTENVASARFCSNCGTALPDEAPPPPPPPPAAPAPGSAPAAPLPAAPPPAGAPVGPPAGGGFPMWAIVAIVGGVLLIGAAVAFILTRDSDVTVQAQTPPDPPGAPATSSGSGAEQQLQALLPPEVTDCRNVEPSPEIIGLGEPVLAALNCEPPDPPLGGGVTVAFYLYESETSAAAAYQGILSAIGLEPDTSACSTTGGQGPAEEAWSGGGGQGRLLCRPTENGSALFWTSDGFPALGGVVSSNPGADVYAVWQSFSDYTR
jgi:zinc-ribbon domain